MSMPQNDIRAFMALNQYETVKHSAICQEWRLLSHGNMSLKTTSESQQISHLISSHLGLSIQLCATHGAAIICHQVTRGGGSEWLVSSVVLSLPPVKCPKSKARSWYLHAEVSPFRGVSDQRSEIKDLIGNLKGHQSFQLSFQLIPGLSSTQ